MLLAGPCSAQVFGAYIDRGAAFRQTDSSAPTTPDVWVIEAAVNFYTGAFTAGTLTYPGPASPLSLNLMPRQGNLWVIGRFSG